MPERKTIQVLQPGETVRHSCSRFRMVKLASGVRMIINLDLIVRASLEDEKRLVLVDVTGHSFTIFSTLAEMLEASE